MRIVLERSKNDRLDCECQPIVFLNEHCRSIQNKSEVKSLATVVKQRPNESSEQLLRRFSKKVAKSGTLGIVHRKRWFVSKSELRRIRKKKAIRRGRRRNFSNRS